MRCMAFAFLRSTRLSVRRDSRPTSSARHTSVSRTPMAPSTRHRARRTAVSALRHMSPSRCRQTAGSRPELPRSNPSAKFELTETADGTDLIEPRVRQRTRSLSSPHRSSGQVPCLLPGNQSPHTAARFRSSLVAHRSSLDCRRRPPRGRLLPLMRPLQLPVVDVENEPAADVCPDPVGQPWDALPLRRHARSCFGAVVSQRLHGLGPLQRSAGSAEVGAAIGAEGVVIDELRDGRRPGPPGPVPGRRCPSRCRRLPAPARLRGCR